MGVTRTDTAVVSIKESPIPLQRDSACEDASASDLMIRIISSNRLAALYLKNILTVSYPTVEIVAVDGPKKLHAIVRVLFVIDGAHLGTPLSVFIKRLALEHPGSLFIVVDGDEREIELPFMLSVGIHGFLLQDQIEMSLIQATEFVAAGRVWVPHQALRTTAFGRDCPTAMRHNTLTHRELEVLELVRRRLSNKEVANALRIQECTVKYHVANLFRKLSINNRKGLTTHSASTPIAYAYGASDGGIG